MPHSTQSNAYCKAFRDSGLQHVYGPDDGPYEASIQSYWSVSAQLQPACIVQPVSTEEVVIIIKTLVQNPTLAGVNFAVRGGGHMVWGGSNNIDHGVTIDLVFLNTTTLDETNGVASIGTGQRWGKVYDALAPLGYTVAGGRASSVGVAGFVTGGGYSFNAARFGFAADTVKNFQVVLASGETVNANAKENSDLFQVLKGGVGSNYGIVTRIDMQAFPTNKLWGGTVLYHEDTTQQHIEAHVAWVDNVHQYPQGSTLFSLVYGSGVAGTVIYNVYHDITGAKAPPAFDKFLAIEQISNTFRTESHKNMTDELDLPDGYRNVWFTMTFRNDAQIYNNIIQLSKKMGQEWEASVLQDDFMLRCCFQGLPTIISEHSLANGGNIMGLDRVKENVVMLLLGISFRGAELEDKAREMMKAYGEKMRTFAASVQGLVDWKYLNYADGYQDPLASYGEENVAKMKAASAKYDPTGLFQDRSPAGFKISRTGFAV